MAESNLKKESMKEALLAEVLGDVWEIIGRVEKVDSSLIESSDILVSKVNEALGVFIVKIETLKSLLESPDRARAIESKKRAYFALFVGISIGFAVGVGVSSIFYYR